MVMSVVDQFFFFAFVWFSTFCVRQRMFCVPLDVINYFADYGAMEDDEALRKGYGNIEGRLVWKR